MTAWFTDGETAVIFLISKIGYKFFCPHTPGLGPYQHIVKIPLQSAMWFLCDAVATDLVEIII